MAAAAADCRGGGKRGRGGVGRGRGVRNGGTAMVAIISIYGATGQRPTANGHRGTTIIHQSSRPRSWQPMFVVVVVAAAATVPMATAKEGAMQESGRAEPKASFAGTSLQSRLEIKVPSIAPSIHLAARFRRRKGPCAPPSPPPRRMFRRSPLAHRRRGGFTGRAHQTLERASVQGPGSRVDRGPSRPAGRPVAGATRHARRFP